MSSYKNFTVKSIQQKGFQSTVDYLHTNRDVLLDPTIDVVMVRERGYPDGNFCWELEHKMNITLYKELSQPASWVNKWVDQVADIYKKIQQKFILDLTLSS